MSVKNPFAETAGLAREPPFFDKWRPTIKNPHIKTYDSKLVKSLLVRETNSKEVP
jgi:hypothetical protein